MKILGITRIYYGSGNNGPQGEQRNANGNHERMKVLAQTNRHKYQGEVRDLLGNYPTDAEPEFVYIYYHANYSNSTHDYFTIIWVDK